MLGNFSYHNPTKLYFGDESLNYLKDELVNLGPVVLLNYGSGSVKRNGIYDQVVAILKEGGKTDEQIAEEGLEALKAWMLEIGLPLTISELGATSDMIPGITEGTICYPAGYLDLKPEDITEILKASI